MTGSRNSYRRRVSAREIHRVVARTLKSIFVAGSRPLLDSFLESLLVVMLIDRDGVLLSALGPPATQSTGQICGYGTRLLRMLLTSY